MLKNKIIFVAGGSGGIGSAVVKACAHAGAKVIYSYFSSKPKPTTQELGETPQPVFLDLNDYENVMDVVENITRDHEQLHGMVNCAGSHIAGPLLSLTRDEIRTQMQTNLECALWLSQAVSKPMIKQRSGSIIHLSSVSAHRMFRGHVTYSATKAGIEGMCKALAAELAKRNVRVNCIMPGPVETEMLKSTQMLAKQDEIISRIPLGKTIRAQEIADMALFLLSNQASSITGGLFPVDGGYTLW